MRLGKAGNCRSARTARARSGASIEELPSATGWLPHTTRAALTGLLKRGEGRVISRSDTASSLMILFMPRSAGRTLSQRSPAM